MGLSIVQKLHCDFCSRVTEDVLLNDATPLSEMPNTALHDPQPHIRGAVRQWLWVGTRLMCPDHRIEVKNEEMQTISVSDFGLLSLPNGNLELRIIDSDNIVMIELPVKAVECIAVHAERLKNNRPGAR